jgi:V8-like Glu-specific endopeptidase
MKRLALCIVVSVLVVFSVTGMASAAERNVWSPEVPQAAAAAIEAYWTAERMKNAIAYPMGISGSPREADAAELEKAQKDQPAEWSSSMTGRPSQLLTQEAAPEASEVEPASSSYPFPHTTYKVLRDSYTVFPYKAIGKVFFTKATGGNYVCSGSSAGGRAVLTAGHCVAEGGKNLWHRNWAFVPAYRGWSSSQRPYGTWTAQYLGTMNEWLYSGRYSRDVGFGVTYNVGGVRLSSKVGYLGFSYNQAANKQHWDAFGYPQASPWNGGEMVQTSAEWARSDCSQGSPCTSGIGSGQRPGSSGGPWIRVFYPNASGANNYANGVFSYYYYSQPNGIYSPYFDSAIYSFRNTAVGL